MKAIILAAGKSPRLLPLTKDIPQPLLKINDRTILELQIDILKEVGIDDISVVTGYLSEMFTGKTIFNPFYSVSGMAASLWIAKEELKDGFIVLYSDILFDAEVIKGLMKNEQDICLAIKKDSLREEAEKVIEEEGIIKKITKTALEGENGEFIGIAKFSSNIVKELEEAIKENLNVSLIGVIQKMIDKGKTIASYDIKDAQFIDIDFPEDLDKAKELWKKNK